MSTIEQALNYHPPPDAEIWIEPHILVDGGVFIVEYITDGKQWLEVNREEVTE